MFLWLFPWSPPFTDCIIMILRPLIHRLAPHLLSPPVHGSAPILLLLLLNGIVLVYLISLPTNSCGMDVTGSPNYPEHRSNSPVLSGIPWISARNLLNSNPCRGFVKWSPSILSFGQCYKVISSNELWYLIKKYRNRMCFVRWVLVSRPFSPITLCWVCPDTRHNHQNWNLAP